MEEIGKKGKELFLASKWERIEDCSGENGNEREK